MPSYPMACLKYWTTEKVSKLLAAQAGPTLRNGVMNPRLRLILFAASGALLG